MLGMTFIEVLVALIILTTGVLGSVALQATAKQASFDAMQRSLASSLAQDVIERMRANNPNNNNLLANYQANDYGVELDAVPDNRCNAVADADACNSAQMVINDQYEWELALMGGDVQSNLGSNAGGLVDGRGCIAVNGNAVTVVVAWQAKSDIDDAAKEACGSAGGKRRQLVIESYIF
jgi:type IV pilus assembly protein PilV